MSDTSIPTAQEVTKHDGEDLTALSTSPGGKTTENNKFKEIDQKIDDKVYEILSTQYNCAGNCVAVACSHHSFPFTLCPGVAKCCAPAECCGAMTSECVALLYALTLAPCVAADYATYICTCAICSFGCKDLLKDGEETVKARNQMTKKLNMELKQLKKERKRIAKAKGAPDEEEMER